MDLATWILSATAVLSPNKDHARFAHATAAVVEAEAPLFDSDDDRHKTAALVVAIAYRESGFKLDAVGDHGRSLCAMQIHYGAKELLTDPERCIRAGMRILRSSVSACKAHPIAVYAHGPTGCTSPRAQQVSLDRMKLAKRVLTSANAAAEPAAPAAKAPDLVQTH